MAGATANARGSRSHREDVAAAATMAASVFCASAHAIKKCVGRRTKGGRGLERRRSPECCSSRALGVRGNTHDKRMFERKTSARKPPMTRVSYQLQPANVRSTCCEPAGRRLGLQQLVFARQATSRPRGEQRDSRRHSQYEPTPAKTNGEQ